MMYGSEKSDLSIVPVKPANNAGRSAAELVEGRDGTRGKAELQSTVQTQSRAAVSQAQQRLREAVNRDKKERLTALLHHVTVDVLRGGFLSLKRAAAAGVDAVTWDAMYVWVAARFYFLLSFVDAYSRYVVDHKLLMSLDGRSVAVELQAALESVSGAKPRVVHDRDAAAVIKTHNLIDIKTKPPAMSAKRVSRRSNSSGIDIPSGMPAASACPASFRMLYFPLQLLLQLLDMTVRQPRAGSRWQLTSDPMPLESVMRDIEITN
jgi:hypothetical protein